MASERIPLMLIHGAWLSARSWYERSPAQTDYVEFEGRPHLLMAADGWEEVAAAVDRWPKGVLEASAAPAPGVSA